MTRDGTEVVMSVRDHGLGLGSRDLKKVGERPGAAPPGDAGHRPGAGDRPLRGGPGRRPRGRPPPIGGGLVIEVRVPLIDDYDA